MASRLNLSGVKPVSVMAVPPTPEREQHRQPVAPVVTPLMVNSAVDTVLDRTSLLETDKDTVRRFMGNDETTDFARSMHASSLHTVSAFPRLKRKRIVIPYVLDSTQIAKLVEYAPDFDLSFSDETLHDHPMAAAVRMIDSEILMRSIPEGVPFKDVGGRVLYHIDRGTVGVHNCNPRLDSKDPTREAMKILTARQKQKTTKNQRVYDNAEKYINGDPSFICHDRAQDCRRKVPITMSSNVFDVPTMDWPVIMASASSGIHLGTVTFPRSAMEQRSGELPMLEARYEIDVEKNTYSMGFIGSAAPWYEHKWSDMIRVSVDQDLVWNDRRFSYKVIERRGDTIFFRVMRVEGEPIVKKRYYRVPGVRMVKVDGFSYAMDATYRAKLGGKLHATHTSALFPARLWNDMLTESMLRFEKGDFTYDKMYNYYRTVSARHTINGVLVSGGEKVSMHQVVDLVVRSGMCAAAKIMLEQRESRFITSQAMADRAWNTTSNIMRILKGFIVSLRTVVDYLCYYPLGWLCDTLIGLFKDSALRDLTSWEYEPVIKEYPFTSLLSASVRSEHYSWTLDTVPTDPNLQLLDYTSGNVQADHRRLLEQNPAIADTILQTAGTVMNKADVQVAQSSAASWRDSSGKASSTLADNITITENDETLRRNAILERLEEGKLERNKIKGVCEKIYRACMPPSGIPNVTLLKNRAEEYDQPDLWYVSSGVLQKSALGLEGSECRHSAVYTLTAHDSDNFRVVRDESADGKDFRVLTTSFTGWALTTDRLLIFNGPEIEHALEYAMSLSHSYIVELQQGPPGCGKTRDLLQNIKFDHVAMCPVRESATDTRMRLVASQPKFPDPKHRISTVHSYLCNYSKAVKSDLVATVLHADEVYMTHSAEWYAVAALLGVERIVAYGDINQIPHVPRVQAAKDYLRIQPNVEKIKNDVYRCPADALAAWGHIYDWKIRTHSKVRKSMSVLPSYDAAPVPSGCIFLCMYQADKREMLRKFASLVRSKGIKIMTVHESEGKTFKHVWLFRFDVRVRSDNTSLYDKPAYALVAMSRHTDTFRYVRPKCLNDVVDTWLARGQDERAIAAASDIESIGISMQFK